MQIFFFLNDGSVIRIPVRQFDRLYNFVPKEALPQYSKKKIKCAIASVKMKDRKPIEIVRIGYPIIDFDSEGRINRKSLNRAVRLGMDSIEPQFDKDIINLGPDLAHRKYAEEFKWSPKSFEVEILKNMIFKT